MQELPMDASQTQSEGPLRGEVTMSLGKAIGIGQSLQCQGNVVGAERVFRQILAVKPKQPEALHFLGVLYHQIGRRDEALQLILSALVENPFYVDALTNLGNLLREQGQFETAESAFRRAISLKPGFAEAHLNLAAMLCECQRYEEAVAESRLAMELTPQGPDMNLLEGIAYSQTEQGSAAAEAKFRTKQNNLFNAGLHDNLAISLLQLGRTEEAADVLRRWIILDPDNPKPRHHLAACTGIDVPLRAADDYVHVVFDEFAESFDELLTSLNYSAPRRLNEAIAVDLGPPQSKLEILDAGCGTGLCGAGIRPFAQRLTGVDLSPKMLAKAQLRGLYDDLIESELGLYLTRSPRKFDVIISADTLVYFGDLMSIVAAAASSLRPGGRFAFTVEKIDPTSAPDGFHLMDHGRYQHTENHVRQAIERAGLEIGTLQEVFLRDECETRVMGWLVICKAMHV